MPCRVVGGKHEGMRERAEQYYDSMCGRTHERAVTIRGYALPDRRGVKWGGERGGMRGMKGGLIRSSCKVECDEKEGATAATFTIVNTALPPCLS